MKKIVLVGTGMVGMSFAYAALNQNLCDELVLCDINAKRAAGEAKDLNHGLAFSKTSMKIYQGTYADCRDADIVVICAGVGQKPGETRLQLLQRNLGIFKTIVDPSSAIICPPPFNFTLFGRLTFFASSNVPPLLMFSVLPLYVTEPVVPLPSWPASSTRNVPPLM